MNKIAPIDYVTYFFTPDDCGTRFTCTICRRSYSQAPHKGVTNLMTHLRSAHATFAQVYIEAKAAGPDTLLNGHSFTSERATGLTRWIEWLVLGNLPLSIADDELYRKNTNLCKTTSKTLRHIMFALEVSIEKKLSVLLPSTFGLIFDGWSSNGTHFCGVFASFIDPTTNQVVCPLLAFSPIGDETTWTAAAHVAFLDETLAVFGKTNANVAFLVGDNCPTNQAIATDLLVPLVGCASHRLNLAVQAYLRNHEATIVQVHAIMTKLRAPKNRGFLRKYSPLAPLLENDTRWTSKFTMLNRFLEFVEILPSIHGIAGMIPSIDEVDAVRALVKICDEFYGYTLLLQDSTLGLHEVRALFDALVERYPAMAHYLAKDADIVHDAKFEGAAVKVLNGDLGSLTRMEKVALGMFKRPTHQPELVDGHVLDLDPKGYAAKVIQDKRQRLCEPVDNPYMDLRFILPTSNIVERVFSKAKLVYSDRRQRLMPVTFEAIMFLAVNRHLWDASMVEETIRQSTLPSQ